jgi:dihydrolipoamide dehydrogenase
VSEPHDLAIIGAGPGGYVTALRAAHHGLRVALIEEHEPGGVCLHTGCIPTKTMAAGVGLLRRAQAARLAGLTLDLNENHLGQINLRRDSVVQSLAQGVQQLLNKSDVQLIHARGRLTSADEIELTPREGEPTTMPRPRALVLATGSRPIDIPAAPRDGRFILNSDDILRMEEKPAHFLILGGGYIGCEFASIFAQLGSQVTLVEMENRLLPGMDPDLAKLLQRQFKQQGIALRLGRRMEAAQTNDVVTLTLDNGETLTGDQLLVAVGRVPNTENLGLETAGVELEGRAIRVDNQMQTTAPGIFAIGDVTGQMQLAHVATAQGRVVVDNLLDENADAKMDYDQVPAAVFTHPEIATIGLTPEQAEERGVPVKVGKFPFAAIGKALAEGERDGFVKLIAHADTGQLLGGHIIGGHAAELIGQITLAIKLKATAEQLAETIFAHPTLSEAVLEAAEGIFGQPTHLPKPRERQ